MERRHCHHDDQLRDFTVRYFMAYNREISFRLKRAILSAIFGLFLKDGNFKKIFTRFESLRKVKRFKMIFFFDKNTPKLTRDDSLKIIIFYLKWPSLDVDSSK